MPKVQEKRTFLVTVEGQYYGVHDLTGVALVKNYTAKFVLPSLEAALSIICKHLLDPYLRKHYSDYARFRSHKITSISTEGRLPDAAVLQMSFDDMGVRDLADFCILKKIMIDPYKHPDLEKCRIEVSKIYQNRRAQEKADAESGKSKVKLDADALLELNELPKSELGLDINVNEQRIVAGLKAKDKVKVSDAAGQEVAPLDEPLPPEVEDDGLLT